MANNGKVVDFKTIKLMPTLLAIMLGFGVINMVLGLTTDHSSWLCLSSELLRFLSVLGLYVCAYRLTGIFREFSLTNIFFALFVFAQLSLNIITWLKQFPLDALLLGIGTYVAYAVSELSIAFGVNSILLGITRKYEEMDGVKEHPGAEKTRRIWITSQILVLVIGGIILPIYTRVYDYMPIGTIIMIVMLAALYLATAIYISIQVYGFSFQYYIYLYNGPKGGAIRR